VWETKLSEKFPPGVEVINFGVGGTGTWQQLQRFHTKARKYKPDITVLVFCWCNDIGDNRGQFISKADYRNPLLDQYEINTWIKLNVKRKNFNKWLWNNSHLYQFTRTRYNHLEHYIKRMFLSDQMKGPVSTLPRKPQLQEEIFSVQRISLASAEGNNSPSLPDFKDTVSIYDDVYFFNSEGWKLTRQLIIKLQSEVQENGSELAVIHLGGNHQQQSTISQLPVKQFDRFLSEQGIEHLNAYELFSQMKDKELVNYFIPNDGHFSKAGHAKFAELAMEFLVKLLQTRT
jgi:lysophospholipase L1-like esterase